MKGTKTKGFTLLEIMIVIAIIGIIVAAASPNFSSSKDQFRLHSFARSCMLDIRYAQQLSVDTKDEHGIYFTATGYQIKKLGTDIIKSVDYDDKVIYEGIGGIAEDEIVFRSSGSPYQAGEIDFKSKIAEVHVYVKVTPGTGEVSMR